MGRNKGDSNQTGWSSALRGPSGRFIESYRVATDWWQSLGERRLPGEEGGVTVFQIEFRDGCRYFGYTEGSVFGRVAALAGDWLGSGENQFVSDHAACVPYLVWCVASGLDGSQARELRNLLVSEAPEGRTQRSDTTLESVGCWLVAAGS